ncbi:hypothetical protein SAMN05421874_12828 [Nonomuraea maritima]|uniref:Uncharacterized protein n=1 Tax=Nonomuraea maritima TaxID=683260 RepID=A0A1G9MGD3_9ACTN|nr:hypothetical protein [Nonomuraea maritima]SDL73322.1 hypothetical protein SAMN05421874_12828 [Nonomuraea maritima]
MWVYHNRNTGLTVEQPERNRIIECYPQWTIVSCPDEPAAPATPSAPGPATEQAPAGPPPGLPPGPPPESANKSIWVAYAVFRGMAEKDAKALSKAALIEEFGQDDTDN